MRGKTNLNPNFSNKGFIQPSEDGVNITSALGKAKQTGSLNIQGRGLVVFPQDICKFSDLRLGESWWDCFELSKIDMSNNLIEEIPPNLADQA